LSRSHATSRYHDLLNKQATEALELRKIQESIASNPPNISGTAEGTKLKFSRQIDRKEY